MMKAYEATLKRAAAKDLEYLTIGANSITAAAKKAEDAIAEESAIVQVIKLELTDKVIL